MNIRAVITYLAYIMRIEAIAMVPALLIAVGEKDTNCVVAFAAVIAGLLLLSLVTVFTKTEKKNILTREGVMITALSWILISLFGALPFYISGWIPSYIDCVFETVSGFTTTGASILTEIESLPRSLLYWRSFTHWLGGMGVLVFMLAIVSLSKNSGTSIYIMQAESPGPTTDKLVPKLKNTASTLYIIYFALTVLQILLLIVGGMPVFDSFIHAFGTAGTGGFSSMNASVGAYDSYYLQGVISVFMILFGINFNVYYLIICKQFKKAVKNGELMLYLGIILVSTLVIAANIYPLFGNIFDSLHHSFFQVSTIITTTGYATADFNLWPQLSKSILLFLMFAGACAGSTGGGIKTVRLLILLKSIRIGLQKRLHPHSVKVMKVSGKAVSDDVVKGVFVYLTIYVAIVIVSVLLISVDNMDFETTFSAVMACFNNIGPGFSVVGATGNYSTFSNFSKIVLSLNMLLGRLEIFPILLLFVPSSWKKAA